MKLEVIDLLGRSAQIQPYELIDWAAHRDEQGYNHLEVARTGQLYPMLTVYFSGLHAAVFRIDIEGGEVYVLNGDSSVASDEVLRFRSPVGYEEFTGEVIVRASKAIRCLRSFSGNSEWPPHLSWTAQ
jgi:hypothetical protein